MNRKVVIVAGVAEARLIEEASPVEWIRKIKTRIRQNSGYFYQEPVQPAMFRSFFSSVISTVPRDRATMPSLWK